MQKRNKLKLLYKSHDFSLSHSTPDVNMIYENFKAFYQYVE